MVQYSKKVVSIWAHRSRVITFLITISSMPMKTEHMGHMMGHMMGSAL